MAKGTLSYTGYNVTLSADFSGPNVLFLKTTEVRFRFNENVAWTRDGEDGGSHREVYIVNRHPGVDLIV